MDHPADGRSGWALAVSARAPWVRAAEVAAKLVDWVEETDVDGFNLAYAITPGTFEDVVEYVVPELQKLGAYPTEYAPGTLRNKLFGRGDRLPENHRAAGFRLQNALVR